MGRLRMERVWRGSGLLLVLAALAIRLITPNGWMLAPGDGHGAPRMVACDGHMEAGGAPGHPDKGGGPRGDHPCAFAGAHAATAPPTLIASLAATPAIVSQDAPERLSDQRPGRGLAAPPPPSQGPPVTST